MPHRFDQSQAFHPDEAVEGMWLVFAKGYHPPHVLQMIRAKSGVWWRKFATEADAQSVVGRLKTAGALKAWYRYETDITARETAAQQQARFAAFNQLKRDLKPLGSEIKIAAPSDRDRSSGRRNYDQVGT